MVGEYRGSGYREPPQLVCRPDGQVIRLPPLLYLIVRTLEQQQRSALAPRSREHVLSHIAEVVSERTGTPFAAAHIEFLIDRKLAPLGVTTYCDGSSPSMAKAEPFLALRFKMAVIPENVTWYLSGILTVLFQPFAIVLVLAAAAASEMWLFSTQPVAGAFLAAASSPASILLVIVLTLASCAFHELGHATACRYGGARPGVMGCGIYLVWPAFYTDITSSYRLGRAGRIRADLGGVYFNALFVFALTVAYLWTGYYPLLIAVMSTNFEILQQLLPTLRFDGYYIISDVVGIPDLFKYIGPILRRTLLRRPADERLRALKRWPQVVVSVWVISIVPLMLAELGLVLVQLPEVIRTDWETIRTLALGVRHVSSLDDILRVLSTGAQIVLLLLPIAGLVLMAWLMVRAIVRFALRYVLSRRSQAIAAHRHRSTKRQDRVA